MSIPAGTVTLAVGTKVSIVCRGAGQKMEVQYKDELYNFGRYAYQCYCNTNKGKQALRSDKCIEANSLREQAQAQYDKMFGEGASTKAEVVTPEPQPVSTIGKVLEDSFIAAITESVKKGIVESIVPDIENELISTFGFKPEVHKIITDKEEFEIHGVVHELFDTVTQFVVRDLPVLLTGPAGSGKNHLVKQVVLAVYGDPDKFFFSNAVTNEYKITGFIDANGRFHETEFYKAFTQGGLFMLDEIDASVPEVLVILNAAIANRYFDFPNGRVDAHPDFRVIAAANTFGTGADLEYTGRFQLDAASLDRFALVPIGYSPAVEVALANGQAEILEFVRDFRNSLKRSGMKFVVSYRAIERMREMVDVLSDEDVLKYCLVKSLDHDDLTIIINEMQNKNNRFFHALTAVA